MAKIRLAFVGVGNMGQCAHLQNYATLPDCEVVALAELRPRLAREVAARYGVPGVYADHRAMIAKEKPDALVAIQYFGHHAALLPELYAAGVPVLTEKPLASTPAGGRKLLAALASTRATHWVAYHKRSDPAVLRARQQIDLWQASGEVGAMRYARISMPPGDWIAGGFNNLIKSDETVPPLAGEPCPPDLSAAQYKHYVYLVNYYVHQVNLLRHFVGDYTVTHADAPGLLLVARAAGNVTATIEMGTHATTIDWQEVAFIAFERGWIKVELPAPVALNRPGRVTIFSDPGKGAEPTTLVPTLPHVHAMRQQAIHFLKAVRGEPSPLCSAKDAMKDLDTIIEYQSLYEKAGGTLRS